MANRAGSVWMTFDDGTSGWVPSRNVLRAKADGGVISPIRLRSPGGQERMVAGTSAGRLIDSGASIVEPGQEQKGVGLVGAIGNVAKSAAKSTAQKAPLALSLGAGNIAALPEIAAASLPIRALAAGSLFGAAGGAGQAISEAANPMPPGQSQVGNVSMQQAMLGTVGELLPAVAEVVATPLLMWAQSNRGSIPLREVFDRARAAIKERVPVGKAPLRPESTMGSKVGSELRAQRSAAARQEVEDVGKYGADVWQGVRSGQSTTFRMNRLSPGLRSLVSQAKRIPGYGTGARKIESIARDLVQKYGRRDIPLEEIHQLRQDMDALNDVIAQSARGKNAKAATPLKRTFAQIASDMRQVLRDPTLGESIPAAEKATQSAIRAEQGAIAGERGLPMRASYAIPATAAGITSMAHPGPWMNELPQMALAGGAARLLAEPWFASRLALGLTNPYFKALLRRGPAMAGAAPADATGTP